MKDKVKTKTSRSIQHMSLAEMLASLNRMLRGWANYFRHGVSKKIFNAVDNHVWHCVTKWIFHKYSRIGWQQLRRRFCQPGTWKLAHGGVTFTGAASVSVIRYRYRGSKIPPPWAPSPAAITSS
ncbi:group II intron maturase-specific domain-containing protein [Streptosporangium sp. NPDC005286]|uniref:group II intron maturase-specific domain-containing protein n=1 Tax=Streptosporangium sp. NPDC005286 TaxID=3154463 RepID=UPI0033AEB1F8